MNNINSFRISVESLKEYCEFHKANVYLQARTKISIKVAVWKQPEPVNSQAGVVEPASTTNSIVPSLEDEVYEEVDLFGTTSIHDPDLSKYTGTQYPHITCMFPPPKKLPLRNE